MKLSNTVEITSIPALELSPEAKLRIEKWIVALRSGKFEKGIGLLREGDSYCCLGVACEVFKDELDEEWVKGVDNDSYTFNREAYALPIELMYKLNLPTATGFSVEILMDYRLVSLANLNDMGVTFTEIADIVEIAMNGGRNYKILPDFQHCLKED